MELSAEAIAVARWVATAALCAGYGWLIALGLRRVRAWQALPESMQPRALAVLVEGRPGAWVNLGTSVEAPDALSGAPRLKPMPFLCREESGRVVMAAPGATLAVSALEGARRTLLDSTTRADGGVDQRYTLEVQNGTRLWLTGLPRASTGDANLLVVDPVGGTVRVSGKEPTPEARPDHFVPGCLVMVVGLAAFAALAASMEWLPRGDAWWVVLALAAVAFFADRSNLPVEPPAPPEEPAPIDDEPAEE